MFHYVFLHELLLILVILSFTAKCNLQLINDAAKMVMAKLFKAKKFMVKIPRTIWPGARPPVRLYFLLPWLYFLSSVFHDLTAGSLTKAGHGPHLRLFLLQALLRS